MIPAGAGLVFLILNAVTVAFQLALVAGAPWGSLTWGGKFPGTLPVPMRGVAAFSAALLTTFGVVVAAHAELLSPAWAPLGRGWIWVVVAYCALGVVANAATPSKWERRIWLPVVLLMFVSSLLVAIAA